VPEAKDDDPVTALRGHVDAAHAAADKLVREASQRAQEADRAYRERLGDVPSRGWDVDDEHRPPSQTSELQVVVALLDAIRGSIPAELSQQLAEALRELLMAVRALIDWYLERLERGPRKPDDPDDRVEEIPIS
jgi:hypothetical protein